MKAIQETLRGGVNPSEYSRIQHMIYFDDFNTNYPNSNRIDRIANEISEYLRYKDKKRQRGEAV